MADRVLAIGAHPDDIEFTCAGTLARLKALGWEVHLVVMTPGDCGSAEHTAEQIAEIRRGEQAQSAALIGAASLQMLEFRDLKIEFTSQARKQVTGALRAVAPTLVLAPPPADYMADHEVTSQLARAACFDGAVPLYETGEHKACEHIPHLYYVDPVEGIDIFGEPAPVSVYVDITAVMDTRIEMLKCHASQRNWLLKQHGMDQYVETSRTWAAKRGAEAARVSGRSEIAHAEAFRQHLGHPYPKNDLLAELLG